MAWLRRTTTTVPHAIAEERCKFGNRRRPWHWDSGTTAVGEHGEFVGRVAGDDCFSGETGAERRAEHAKATRTSAAGTRRGAWQSAGWSAHRR